MKEPNRFMLYVEHVTWLLREVAKGHFSGVAVHILEPKLIRLLPARSRDWLYARWEWSVCREFNDGPDDCYLPWKEYWKKGKEARP